MIGGHGIGWRTMHSIRCRHLASLAPVPSARMYETDQIWLVRGSRERLESRDDVNRIALTFGADVAGTYRLITLRRKTTTRPPFIGCLQDQPERGKVRTFWCCE